MRGSLPPTSALCPPIACSMLLTLAAYYYLHVASPDHVLPHLTVSTSAQKLFTASDSSCRILGECRTMTDIVWSCLATIFACTWVAIHPNIPSPRDSWLTRTSRRIGITLMALIAPEVVIMWAMRQWLAARDLRDIYREHDWTMTHGFFAIMGGFMLYDENGPKYVLLPEILKDLSENGTIDFPDITKGEIQDRSKNDLLSKGLVILQTTWFIVQCGARGIKGLPLTELEIVTLAYAAVNFATYFIWWHKPLNVQYAYRVQRKLVTVSSDVTEAYGTRNNRLEPTQHGQQDPLPGGAASSRSLGFVGYCYLGAGALLAIISLPVAPFLDMGTGLRFTTGGVIHLWRVPTFFSGTDERISPGASIVTAIVATGFGAIHCIAWSFKFHTPHELLLWRISSVVITAFPLPLLSVLSISETNAYPRTQSTRNPARVSRGLKTVWLLLSGLASTLYVFARLDILVQALMALRAPPEGVFKTVQWTTFIPHL